MNHPYGEKGTKRTNLKDSVPFFFFFLKYQKSLYRKIVRNAEYFHRWTFQRYSFGVEKLKEEKRAVSSFRVTCPLARIDVNAPVLRSEPCFPVVLYRSWKSAHGWRTGTSVKRMGLVVIVTTVGTTVGIH